MKMKMENSFYVEPEGIAGGLALWWSQEAKLTVLHYDKNFIDTGISINGEPEWFGTFIYAPPYEEEKQCFWERLGTLRNDVNAKWCIMGDTNIVASPNEKYGGSPYDHNNAKCKEDEICEKLDRVLSSLEWRFLFPKAIAIIDIAIASDHAPIVLLANGIMKKAKRDFKFESRWLLEEECSQMVEEEWTNIGGRHHRGTFRVSLRRTKVKLGKWSREKSISKQSTLDRLR
ncbi:hypothetical protein V6N12_068996 [Hibiscus sabdariffa]|uniref:Endonuclease/exonuclease/phosphatase domain-containing protein n=1 Tax=Hibiscus sabdariffa TaxID=183260 RepID=A0ABR2CC43_9ROSI